MSYRADYCLVHATKEEAIAKKKLLLNDRTVIVTRVGCVLHITPNMRKKT